MPKFYHSIRFQITMSVIVASFTAMSLSFYVFRKDYSNQMIDSFRDDATHLNEAMENYLELVMQTKDVEEMKRIIRGMEERYDVERAFILATDGTIKISSNEDEIGDVISTEGQICIDCHQREPEEQIKTETVAYGNTIMRSINPIVNKPLCYGTECHPSTETITGMLMLDYSMEPVMNQISGNIRRMIFIFGGIAVVLISLFFLLLNKVIFGKLTNIVEIAKSVGKGDITQRIQAMGKNEISLLATSFNQVLQNLEESTEECKKSNDNLAHLINSIKDSILVVDREYRVVMANKAAVASINISMEEAKGLPCYQISSHHTGKPNDKCPNYYCPTARTFETHKLEKAHHTCLDENGETRHIEIYSSPLLYENGEVAQVVEVMRDITERKHLEAQLDHSEKLSSLGRIAAGIAHEINNPIAAIAACVEGLQRQLKNIEPEAEKSLEDLPQYLETIRQSAYRCEVITRKLLIFSRQTETIFELVNPNDVIEDVLDLVKHEAIWEHKNINPNLAEDIPRIQADKSQLSQVVLNLTHNALDAIDASGEVTITTRQATDAIEIIFEDTGCGIAKENLQKIFEPFFTTKPVGKGTGLGLSISEGIIRKHRGDITVSSEIGIGTTFRIVLPTNPPG